METRAERVGRRFEKPMLVAALLVIPVIVIEESGVEDPWRTFAAVLNWIIWLAFLCEAAVMLALTRLRWARDHPLELAIVVLTPPFLPQSLQAARALRLVRLLRLLRLARLARQAFSLAGLRHAALIAVVTALAGGTAFASAEKDVGPWEGIYWAVTTMTTVGYGDIPPKSDLGRIIAIAVMLVGIGFVSLIVGAVAQRFVVEDVRHEVEELGDETSGEIHSMEADVRRELREIAVRLGRLEAMLGRQSGA